MGNFFHLEPLLKEAAFVVGSKPQPVWQGKGRAVSCHSYNLNSTSGPFGPRQIINCTLWDSLHVTLVEFKRLHSIFRISFKCELWSDMKFFADTLPETSTPQRGKNYTKKSLESLHQGSKTVWAYPYVGVKLLHPLKITLYSITIVSEWRRPWKVACYSGLYEEESQAYQWFLA